MKGRGGFGVREREKKLGGGRKTRTLKERDWGKEWGLRRRGGIR